MGELQSGKITMSSQRGAVTIVTVEIPYKITLAAVSQHIIKPDFFDMRSLEGKKILIADDSDLNRVLLSQLLQKWNVQFSEAKDGKEALQQLEKQEYDLLLMDVRMPEMDGLEATMKIRAQKNKSYSNIPIIALTAAVTEEEMEVYRTAGMNDILAKPFQENELLQKIIPVFQNAAVS